MRHFCLTVLIFLMILLVTNPSLVDSRALASATKNESDDHHAATDPIDDRGSGSVSTNMKASVDPEPVNDAGGGQVSGAEREVYKVASSGPSGKGAGH
ncbi:hypothetical protein POTOM_021400 [Populus tomentosa]|uniref:Uncharacterized protein n=1 Tax=Populus tomentosa TaxID=118781 RepID=A0A8X8CSG2_POPTO|nr:hypothetical protein POTOM_021400 [Populus tomentosa]